MFADLDDDEDGVDDQMTFPLNATESVDTDGDGIRSGDTDDGDGVLDVNDVFAVEEVRYRW